ncbi:MAG: hypothetical protein NTZ05_23275, partial [Chloroflexi bacterium]|nr:hypothetical protein [Chloroflexota bacterium]
MRRLFGWLWSLRWRRTLGYSVLGCLLLLASMGWGIGAASFLLPEDAPLAVAVPTVAVTAGATRTPTITATPTYGAPTPTLPATPTQYVPYFPPPLPTLPPRFFWTPTPVRFPTPFGTPPSGDGGDGDGSYLPPGSDTPVPHPTATPRPGIPLPNPPAPTATSASPQYS